MKIVGYVRGNKGSDVKVMHFGDAIGVREYQLRSNPTDCDLAIYWGFRPSAALSHTIETQTPFIILENPIWGDRKETFTWAYNGQNGMGTIPDAAHMPERRKPDLQPWKSTGETTIFGQLLGDMAVHDLDINGWINECAAILPGSHVRRHPGDYTEFRGGPLEDIEKCLARTGLAITYSSAVGSEAVIAGVPTIAMHPASLAWDVTTHNLTDEPILPNREKWLHNLSWRHIYKNEPVPVDFILKGYDALRAVHEGPQAIPIS